MTEAKWTPGPWHWVNADTDEPWDGCENSFIGMSLRTVEEFGERKTEIRDGKSYTSFRQPKFVLDHVDDIGNIEDARLIASAPALVEALAWFVDREAPIQAKFNLYGPEDTAAAMRDAFRAARSALTGNAND